MFGKRDSSHLEEHGIGTTSKRYAADEDIIPEQEVYGLRLAFDHTKCDHGDGLGTDLEFYHRQFQGDGFYIRNREAFFDGVTQGTIFKATKDLIMIILHENLDVTYDAYSYEMVKYEHIFRAEKQLYDLYMVASFHAIYAHSTMYFGLKDLFKDHFQYITNLVGRFGASDSEQIMLNYDNQIHGILNGSCYGYGNTSGPEKSDYVHNMFVRDYYRDIVPYVKILASLLILDYFGLVNIQHKNYITENIKKAGCTYTIHNLAFDPINDHLGVEGYTVNTWFGNLQTRHGGIRFEMDCRFFDFMQSLYEVKTKRYRTSTLKTACTNMLSRYYYFDVNEKILVYPISGSYGDMECPLAYFNVQLPSTVKFMPNFWFILFSTSLSVSTNVAKNISKHYEGPVAIIAKGMDVHVYSLINNTFKRYRHLYEIKLNHDHYHIWVKSISSKLSGTDNGGNRLILARYKRYPEFIQMAKSISGFVNNLGMNRDRERCIIEWYLGAVPN